MDTGQRLEIFKQAKDIEQKYDHFMAGLIAAILAYTLPQAISDEAPLLFRLATGAGLLALVGALIAAIRRLRMVVHLAGLNHQEATHQGDAQNMEADIRKLRKSPPGETQLAALADTLSQHKDRLHKAGLLHAEAEATQVQAKAATEWRDWLFLGGLSALAAAKVILLAGCS